MFCFFLYLSRSFFFFPHENEKTTTSFFAAHGQRLHHFQPSLVLALLIMVDPELPRLRVFLRTTQAKNLIEPRTSRQIGQPKTASFATKNVGKIKKGATCLASQCLSNFMLKFRPRHAQNARAQANFLTTWFSAGAGRQPKSPISLNASEANRGHRWAPSRPPHQIRSNEDRRSN